jgi:hypothetical protein
MANTYLTRSKSSPTSDKKGTISFWIKRSDTTSEQATFVSGGGSIDSNIFFDTSSKLNVYDYQSGAYQFRYVTSRVFRDPNAWYHIVVRIDTTDGTAGDRVKIYVNGVQETAFDTSTNPSQNLTPLFFTNTYAFWIGSYRGSSGYTNGLYTHFHYTDGYTYAATDFGETDSTSGIWKPKTAPSVTHGNNGFFLKFENSGAMGTDSSGNTNTFTVSGTLTQNVDTPSNNFATLNPLVSRKGTLTNGNLTHEGSGATAPNNVISSLGVTSGKFYIEAKIITANNYNGFGVVTEKNPYVNGGTDYLSNSNDALMYVYSDIYRGGGTISGTYATLATNDIVQIAIDADNKFLYFGVNGTWQNSSDPTSGASGTGALNMTTYLGSDVTYFIGSEQGGAGNTRKIEFNFGQGYFGTTAVASANADGNGHGAMEYSVPSGYYTLNTKNLKEFG